jgi:hypothetical protein
MTQLTLLNYMVSRGSELPLCTRRFIAGGFIPEFCGLGESTPHQTRTANPSGNSAPPRGNHHITELKTPRRPTSQYPVSRIRGVAVANTLISLAIKELRHVARAGAQMARNAGLGEKQRRLPWLMIPVNISMQRGREASRALACSSARLIQLLAHTSRR